MPETHSNSLLWSSQFTVTPPQHTPKLPGDKIILPQSALEQLLAAAPLQEIPASSSSSRTAPSTNTFDPFNPHTFAAEAAARARATTRQPQLPHPLTFRIEHGPSGRTIYAGIREFSAAEGEVGLSAGLRESLGLDGDDGASETSTVTVTAATLPKGTYVRLRPLEAGYDAADWKALLERHLRDNYTTLTRDMELSVRAGAGRDESFRFLVDRVEPPGAGGICVVDTDLEVDMLALSEEQARETLRRRVEKAAVAPGTRTGSSMGGVLAVGEKVAGQVVAGEYVDYEVQRWERAKGVRVQAEVEGEGDGDAWVFVSPLSARQRSRPRADEHVFGEFSSRATKRIDISPTNIELDGAEALYVSVHAAASAAGGTSPVRYTLRVGTYADASAGPTEEVDEETGAMHDADDVQCANCQQWVPARTIQLHETFCQRNNAVCPHCGRVFQKRSEEWQQHWHCPHDSSSGDDAASRHTHDTVFHTARTCPACGAETGGLPQLARHRTTDCPAKPILCRFCHLVVAQKGEGDPELDDADVLVSGLTPHELVDGGRTTECHLCRKIIRLRDMSTHLRHHDLERLSRPAPRICLNRNCGRTLDGRAGGGHDTLGLCSICFGPLYVDTYDPDGKALRRRIERRYLSQMLTGCGKPWCQNEFCKNGRDARNGGSQTETPSSTASIMAATRPLVSAVRISPPASEPNTAPFYFCADQAGQQRRVIAEMMAAEDHDGKRYALPWCVAAVEASSGEVDKAREWLESWAPAEGEKVQDPTT